MLSWRGIVDTWWRRLHPRFNKTYLITCWKHLCMPGCKQASRAYLYTKSCRVQTLQGKKFWRVTFASDDPYQGFFSRRRTIRLFRNLPPRWFRES
ncbi:hypothetical protein M405DRAFT_2486 [Rhizopogon salebrosus TDB-379]|nr:hypothetical protein M405DRAFT_2486 [Rhizopogon salebrosus TDB-379]